MKNLLALLTLSPANTEISRRNGGMLAALALALALGPASLGANAADAERAQELMGVCATCHGEFGQGGSRGEYPRLAGQSKAYLAKQLQNFRARKRINIPMFPYTEERELSDEDLARFHACNRGGTLRTNSSGARISTNNGGKHKAGEVGGVGRITSIRGRPCRRTLLLSPIHGAWHSGRSATILCGNGDDLILQLDDDETMSMIAAGTGHLFLAFTLRGAVIIGTAPPDSNSRRVRTDVNRRVSRCVNRRLTLGIAPQPRLVTRIFLLSRHKSRRS